MHEMIDAPAADTDPRPDVLPAATRGDHAPVRTTPPITSPPVQVDTRVRHLAALTDHLAAASTTSRIRRSPAGTFADRPAVAAAERVRPRAAVVQRRMDLTGGDESQLSKVRIRTAFETHKTALGSERYDAFIRRYGPANGPALGAAIYDMRHDPTDLGRFDLDNESHVELLFHELMTADRHDKATGNFSYQLATAFETHKSALMSAAKVSEDTHNLIVLRLNRSWNRRWLRGVLISLNLRPTGDDLESENKSKKGLREMVLGSTIDEDLRAVYRTLAGRIATELDTSDTAPIANKQGHTVEQYAFLGTGAAVAYHMAANSRSINPATTIVVGKQQPWKPGSEGDRAFTSVNHSLAMISPKRDATALDDPSFADTAKFSKEIEDVIDTHCRTRIDAFITPGGVTKLDNGYYSIATDKGTFYAKHVVSALGIGKHKDPVGSETVQDIDRPRVIDMDEFHRQLRDTDSPLRSLKDAREKQGGKLEIVLIGPNAAVDVAYSASNADIDVVWFTSTKPAWVKGFANYGLKKENIRIILHRFDNYTVERDANTITGVKATAGSDSTTPLVVELLGEQKIKVIDKGEAEAPMYDYLVYAVGPDNKAQDDVFSKEIQDQFGHADSEIKDATHGRFSSPVPKIDALKLSGGDIEANLLAACAAWPKLTDASGAVAKAKGILGGLNPVAAPPNDLTLNLRVSHADGSTLEIVGAHAARLKTKEMAKVTDTYGPTVVGNDQLTPSRGRAEASADFVPGYIGRSGGVNLVTDDQTVIALYIAMTYKIPALLADYVTRRIIADRVGRKDESSLDGFASDSGIRPDAKIVESFGGKFTAEWIRRLRDLEKLFP